MGSEDYRSKVRRGASGRGQTLCRLLVVVCGVAVLLWCTAPPPPAAERVGRPLPRKVRAAERAQVQTPQAVGLRTGDTPARVQPRPVARSTHDDEQAATKQALPARGAYRFTAVDIDGTPRALSQFSGQARLHRARSPATPRAVLLTCPCTPTRPPPQVTLVVNVASACGYTASNYAGLQASYDRYKDGGFAVLAFPCNQFGAQEPGSDAEVKAFAARQGATFPLFSKIDVKGDDAHPLWEWLTAQPGVEGEPSWNFNKFLVGRNGAVLRRYGPEWDDARIRADIADALKSAYEEADAFR